MAAPYGVEVSEARQIVLATVRPLASEPVPLTEASGRVLAEDLRADADVPGFRSAAMDGYTVRAQDTVGAGPGRPVLLRLVGESRAGWPATTVLAAGEAMAISTGAMIPDGADAVVRLERASPTTSGSVAVEREIESGSDLRDPASEIVMGALLMPRGARLSATGVGALASLGRASVACAQRPRVCVLATGDELVPGAGPLRDGQLHDCNSHVLGTLVQAAGGTLARRRTVPDDPGLIRGAISAAVSDSDVLVLSGGVSRGVHDHVRPSLDALGATCSFWRMNLRPGAPTWFGVLDGMLVFALPGNPVAAITIFALIVAPALAALEGRPPPEPLQARLEGGYAKPAGRAHALTCRLCAAPDGLYAVPTRKPGARGLGAVLDVECIALIPAERESVAPGEAVHVVPVPGAGITGLA
jgi:molybdopterin molybdotransferase